jgi:hypothetical protein
MRKLFIVLIILISSGFYTSKIYAQCSDAGICQLGTHLTEGENELFNISGAYKYGYSGKEDDIRFHSFVLDGSYNLLAKSSVQFLIPYNIQSGPAESINGIGDLIISWNQLLFSDENSSFSASLGTKLATGDDNKDNLPQKYQSGLGANDVLFGLSYTYDKISVGAGYQLAGGRNDNIQRLERGDDLLLRASYQLSFDQFSIIPQLLFIQRLTKSTILDTTSTDKESFVEVDKSDQAQLNFLAKLEYEISKNISLVGDFAIPFIKREVNVDGLTRAYSASIGVTFSIY